MATARADEPTPPQPSAGAEEVQTLLRLRCIKCHGALKPEAGLSLGTLIGVARGGESGLAVIPSHPEESLLWQRVSADEMPPKMPLSADEKELLRQWITTGASGLPRGALAPAIGADHWAFQKLARSQPPTVNDAARVRTAIDRFVLARLEAQGLSLGPDAQPQALIRRVSFDLTGLPPTVEELRAFLADGADDAYERMVDRYLASPRYGERWGQYWLDAAGYADSSGYFSNERDRPLAYRYRDYVVAALNRDIPFDQFVREQLAGDEISGYRPGEPATAEVLDQLVATHFLRNAPDGTDQSAPSPEAQRLDRYAALEGTQQIVASSLLALSLKCARCHDHKFEPITQQEYYQWQSILLPALNPSRWTPPLERKIRVPLSSEVEQYAAHARELDERLAALKQKAREVAQAFEKARQRGIELFRAEFGQSGEAAPPGWREDPAVEVAASGGGGRVGAHASQGTLHVVARPGRAWLKTQQSFDWTPAERGQWIQATFALIADRATPDAPAAERIGYYLAATDEASGGATGYLLIDGNPSAATTAYHDPPAGAAQPLGMLTKERYASGHNYGVRVTNIGGGKYRLDHLTDFSTEAQNLIVSAADLPDGPFAFYQGSNRSFIVDDLVIEAGGPAPSAAASEQQIVLVDRADQPLASTWVDAAPAGSSPEKSVLMEEERADRNFAVRRGSRLIVHAAGAGEAALQTRDTFDWTPDAPGDSIQVTFDLIEDVVDVAGGKTQPAGYFGFYLALANECGLLVDGGPQGAHVYPGYPVERTRKLPLGKAAYGKGRNYGARITNAGEGRFRLEHLIDLELDGEPLMLSAAELPDGGFGFFFGAARSFVIDDVTIATGRFTGGPAPALAATRAALREQREQLANQIAQVQSERATPVGTDLAWSSDAGPEAPHAFVLKRGDYAQPDTEVQPAGLAVLTDADSPFAIAPATGDRTTGRRLALATWMTKPDTRPAALLARVQANRVWMHHFGRGIAPNPDNLGLSGAPPSNPELLEELAAAWSQSGWSLKALHRQIMTSTTYRQTSVASARSLAVDPANRWLSRFPLRRLDAEEIRDAMLAASGELDLAGGGPFVPIDRHGSEQEVTRGALNREIVVDEKTPGAHRRSIYLEHRRAQLPTFLALFGTPSIALNCVERQPSTVPLQSLAQLNSEFARLRSLALAERLATQAGAAVDAQLSQAFLLVVGREPSSDELAQAGAFLAEQRTLYAPERAERQALADFCQGLLASNLFLYVE